jgi:anaerobic ribonucleoside-triphosphate reductase
MTEPARVAERISSQASAVLTDGERQRCEVWTRVMGYHRPVSSFNTGKKGEFNERRYFEERRCEETIAP